MDFCDQSQVEVAGSEHVVPVMSIGVGGGAAATPNDVLADYVLDPEARQALRARSRYPYDSAGIASTISSSINRLLPALVLRHAGRTVMNQCYWDAREIYVDSLIAMAKLRIDMLLLQWRRMLDDRCNNTTVELCLLPYADVPSRRILFAHGDGIHPWDGLTAIQMLLAVIKAWNEMLVSDQGQHQMSIGPVQASQWLTKELRLIRGYNAMLESFFYECAISPRPHSTADLRTYCDDAIAEASSYVMRAANPSAYEPAYRPGAAAADRADDGAVRDAPMVP
jgi:hypothetical protein